MKQQQSPTPLMIWQKWDAVPKSTAGQWWEQLWAASQAPHLAGAGNAQESRAGGTERLMAAGWHRPIRSPQGVSGAAAGSGAANAGSALPSPAPLLGEIPSCCSSWAQQPPLTWQGHGAEALGWGGHRVWELELRGGWRRSPRAGKKQSCWWQ